MLHIGFETYIEEHIQETWRIKLAALSNQRYNPKKIWYWLISPIKLDIIWIIFKCRTSHSPPLPQKANFHKSKTHLQQSPKVRLHWESKLRMELSSRLRRSFHLLWWMRPHTIRLKFFAITLEQFMQALALILDCLLKRPANLFRITMSSILSL